MTTIIGLTGSIGMGKTTTAAMFAEAGVPVWNADAAVHRLYGQGGKAIAPIARLCPEAVVHEQVDREALKRWIAREEGALGRLESVVHPLVAEDRRAFLAATRADAVVLDVPLLFETGGDAACDVIVVVSAPPEVQRARVLSRPGMTDAAFARLLATQMPDAEKRARADYVVETTTLETARASVHNILREVQGDKDA
jgi:dephospho-CoA kinase